MLIGIFTFSIRFIRFQVAVLSFYKQIFAQGSHVLSNIDKDNFDVAFGFLRPCESSLFPSFLPFCLYPFILPTVSSHANSVSI